MEASQKVEQLCNRQFYDLIESKARYFVSQGGTRSGKTYAICQYLIYLLTTREDAIVIDVIRKTLPALKASIMRDFFSIAESTGVYFDGVHNKAENTFQYGKHLVRFLSIDQPQKIRGSKRNIAILNEGNELDKEDLVQVAFRCSEKIIIDFNPSDPIHWIYEDIITRDDCETIITTYKDNNFLAPEIVKEIERMKEKDPDYWRVYGEGQRAVYSARQIFSNWNFIPYSDFPEFDLESEAVIGLDFGFSSDPAAACLVFKKQNKLYVHEILYKTGMTNQDLATFLKEKGYDRTLTFYDSAEPKSGEELRRMGIFAKAAIKGQGSINAGISLLKEFDVYVSKESKNFAKEYSGYYWEQLKDGTIINKPKDRLNHLMDSLRYCTYSQYSRRSEFFVI